MRWAWIVLSIVSGVLALSNWIGGDTTQLDRIEGGVWMVTGLVCVLIAGRQGERK